MNNVAIDTNFVMLERLQDLIEKKEEVEARWGTVVDILQSTQENWEKHAETNAKIGTVGATTSFTATTGALGQAYV